MRIPETNLTLKGSRKDYIVIPDYAPEQERHKMEITFYPLPGITTSKGYLSDFLGGLTDVCGMQRFFGPRILESDPVVITDETADGFDSADLHGFPRDVNFYIIWRKSHVYGYIYGENGLCSLELSSCASFQLDKVLKYVYEKLHPRGPIRYRHITPNKPVQLQEYSVLEDGSTFAPETPWIKDLHNIIWTTRFGDQQEIKKAGRALEKLVLEAKNRTKGRLILSLTPFQQENSRSIYREHEGISETDGANLAIEGKMHNVKEFPLYPRYFRLNQREVSALGIAQDDIVYIIGLGKFGISAMNISDISGAHIVGIDRDPEAVQIGQKVTDRLGYKGRIEYRGAEGAKVNLKDASVVIIAAMAEGKDEILANIFKQKPQIPVIVRGGEDSCGLLYEPLKRNPFYGDFDYLYYNSEKIFPPERDDDILSFVLLKHEDSASTLVNR